MGARRGKVTLIKRALAAGQGQGRSAQGKGKVAGDQLVLAMAPAPADGFLKSDRLHNERKDKNKCTTATKNGRRCL